MKQNLKFKNFKVDSFKADDNNQLIISGWAAAFGNIDSYGDIIQFGAFTKTLADRKDRIAFCYQHEIDEPIGKILLLEERPFGLWVEVAISASESDIQIKIKEGILKEMSIGYRTINCLESMVEESLITTLTEIKLYEISLVTIAANPLATVEMMKSEERKNYFNDAFDRLIGQERSDRKKFELEKLKSQIEALIEKQPDIEKKNTVTVEPPSLKISEKQLINLLH